MFRQSNPKKQVAKMPSPTPESQGGSLSASNQPLLRAVISYTGLTIKEREVVNKKVREMGGQVNVDLTEDITHLIASRVGSDKYRVAFGLRIPVLEPGWLDFLYNQWCKGQTSDLKQAIEDFAMGPLKGCSICVTGLPLDQRQAIQRDTIQYGGKYTSDLLKSVTTHLICGHPSGEKYTSALQWGVKCVSLRWLKDTMARLELVDETKYAIVAQDQEKSAQGQEMGEVREAAGHIDERSEDRALVVPDQMYLEACYVYLCPSFSAAQATQYKKMIRMAGGVLVTDTIALFSHDGDIPYIVNQNWLLLSVREGKALPEANHIVPFPTRTEDGLPKPVRFDGAKTWTTDPALNSRDNDSKAASNTNTNMATLRSKSRAPTESDTIAPSTPKKDPQRSSVGFTEFRSKGEENGTKSSPDRTPVSSPSNRSPQETRNGLRTRTVSGILSEALDVLSMDMTTTQLMATQENSLVTRADLMNLDEEEETPSNIFLGLHITSHGCSEKCTQWIREETAACGGTYFEDSEDPPPGAHVRTIVPLSMSLDRTKGLRGMVLTTCWFQRSVEEDRVVSRQDHFLYKPMKTVPIQGFQDLIISVTNFEELEYEQIGRAIKLLGATFMDKLRAGKTNLLISDHAKGPKYEYMAKERQPIVRVAWLQACIEQGRRLPFEGFLLQSDIYSDRESERSDSGSSRMHSGNSNLSSETTRTDSNADFSQLTPAPPPTPSDTPLQGLAICLPSRVIGDHREMQDMIAKMGARLFTSFDLSSTHLIHKGRATPDTKRDLRAAKKEHRFIVSPTWLYKCWETGLRVDEQEYPETFDDKHLTLNTVTHTPKERPGLSVLPKRSSSPSSLRASSRSGSSGRRGTSGAGFGRAATAGFQPHRQGAGQPSPTQTFQGTAAGVTSGLYGGDHVLSSINMSPTDTTLDMSMSSMMDMQSLQYRNGGLSDSDGVWQPVPGIPVVRNSGRKRRRPLVGSDSQANNTDMNTSAIYETPQESNETQDEYSIPENYFDKPAERYGKDAVIWVDTEGREKKRALLESLGYKTFRPSPKENADARLESVARDMDSQRCPRYYFLLTGISVADRTQFKKSIQNLGGVVLEDINDDHDDWQQKCTHLITNGNNPPRTAKLVIARACKAIIVNKGFILASSEKGTFVDETPFRVNI
ncbi:hypothetical protein BC939DRAFT_506054 [Gamsiella multidivaricata]|uniref:uncharacterized protein n=1 Tax=Gamsiella multidivaricata TaxID=101098 RepID=UPI00221F92B7|nr:uncharacterized protein BC939DRAFT_506054 [Gamsiella multidivaricata]KAI7819092.1 hypothetical protein BC939DRAFT_506054 [Gamsiella multidivaricata]